MAKLWDKTESKLSSSDLPAIQSAMSDEIVNIPSQLREHLDFEDFIARIMEARSLRDLNPEGSFMDVAYADMDIDVDNGGILDFIGDFVGALFG